MGDELGEASSAPLLSLLVPADLHLCDVPGGAAKGESSRKGRLSPAAGPPIPQPVLPATTHPPPTPTPRQAYAHRTRVRFHILKDYFKIQRCSLILFLLCVYFLIEVFHKCCREAGSVRMRETFYNLF